MVLFEGHFLPAMGRRVSAEDGKGGGRGMHGTLKKIAFPLARSSLVWIDCSAAKQRVTGVWRTEGRPH